MGRWMLWPALGLLIAGCQGVGTRPNKNVRVLPLDQALAAVVEGLDAAAEKAEARKQAGKPNFGLNVNKATVKLTLSATSEGGGSLGVEVGPIKFGVSGKETGSAANEITIEFLNVQNFDPKNRNNDLFTFGRRDGLSGPLPGAVTPGGSKLVTLANGAKMVESSDAWTLVPADANSLSVLSTLSQSMIDRPFAGKYRKAVKTAFYRVNSQVAPVSDCQSLDDLLAWLGDFEHADGFMAATYPKMSNPGQAPTFRVPEEQHNVCVQAYLHGAKLSKDDNDFHVMIGTDETWQASDWLTIEFSGLPPANAPDYAAMRALRKSLIDTFIAQQRPISGGGYAKLETGIPVQIRGSLYFDGAHTNSLPGPIWGKPETAWEIHPVMSFEVLQE